MTPPIIDRDEELYWLALQLVPGLGARGAGKLLDRFRAPAAIFRASRTELEAAGVSGAVAQSISSGCTFEDGVAQQEKMAAAGAVAVTRWPSGSPRTWRTPVSPSQRHGARHRHGGAQGRAGGGRRHHRRARLRRRRGLPVGEPQAAGEIGAKGLIVSEFPMGATAFPQNFPIRNRIISGMSCGSAGGGRRAVQRLGHHRRLAMDQGREVFAVPGNITSKMSWGPNLLIKQGAKLVQDWNDVVVRLPPNPAAASNR
jgi:DNA processing protein